MAKASYKTLYERARFLNVFGQDLERISHQLDPRRVIRFALRRIGESLQADLAVQVDLDRSDSSLLRPYTLPLTPKGHGILERQPRSTPAEPPVPGFREACRAFVQRSIGPADHHMILLRVVSEDRPVSVLGFLRPGRRFSREEVRHGQDAAVLLCENLGHRERERAEAVREKIYAKVLSETRPQDVLYQILHGLKRLLQYDHGAAVLLLEPGGDSLRVEAEIIAWTKAKSARIGTHVPVTPELREWLDQTKHPQLLRPGEARSRVPANGEQPALRPVDESHADAREMTTTSATAPGKVGGESEAVEPAARATGTMPKAAPEEDAVAPAALRAPLHSADPNVPRARSVLAAVLRHRQHPLGVLKICSTSVDAFTPADIRVLDQFLPLASITLYNSTLYKAQHDLLLTAERKTALADLARAISHDLNNAFGVILPLLQTMRRDLDAGEAERDQLARDLEILEHYASSSSRIFQGLISVARGGAEPARWADLNPILDAVLRMLSRNLERLAIEVARDFREDLPRVYFRRGEMEQIFLNLIYNARDAMPEGGTLSLRSAPEDGGVRIEVEDTGTGIPEEIRSRIFEPFFTTKREGSGLGLDICRSLVWDYDGRLRIDSAPGQGTRVTVWLPPLSERLRETAEGEGLPAGLAPPDRERDGPQAPVETEQHP